MDTKHPLVRHASDKGIRLAQIAREANCSRMSIYRVIEGNENVTLDLLRKISAATGGEVSVSELIGEGSNTPEVAAE